MTSTQVALALGWDCFVGPNDPYWKHPNGLRSDSPPDYMAGQCIGHISSWAIERGYALTCNLMPDGVLAWFERDEEDVENACYADTIAEAVCYAFLDLHSSIVQNKNIHGE